MAFRFVHAADIHLDSPLRTLALRDVELAQLVGDATRRAFTAIVDLCLDEQVEALLLAGDLYDGEQTSMKTARFLADQLNRLDAAGVRVLIIRGNHDAESKITTELTLPGSVKIFASRAEVQSFPARDGRQIAVHGMSFRNPIAPDSLLPRYHAPMPGAINIGMMHTSLDGSPGHDVYAPCKLVDLLNSGFTYWALGHIHKRAVHHGRSVVVMPGMPQGRDINEAGVKSATLVSIDDDGSVQVEERPTGIAQFERLDIDVTPLSEWRDVVQAINSGLAAARQAGRSQHVILRLKLIGNSDLAWRLRRDAALMQEEAAVCAARVGNCWIEGLEIACQTPTIPLAAGDRLTADPVQELQRLIESDVRNSPVFQQELQEIADELRKQLPRECRDLLGGDATSQAALTEALLHEGVEDVLARLQPRTRTETA